VLMEGIHVSYGQERECERELDGAVRRGVLLRFGMRSHDRVKRRYVQSFGVTGSGATDVKALRPKWQSMEPDFTTSICCVQHLVHSSSTPEGNHC